jgi:pyruvate/2-oxoglutarate dehydrogenase complex dihydrolipoamide dehydrogenase (E3) component
MTNLPPETFDAIIIGAGQAGKPLALALAGKGRKTAIIERNYLGGTCINYGCTPTKTLLASAQMAYQARRSGEYGVHTGEVKVNMKEVKKRKDKIVEQFRKSVQDSLDKAENLTLIRGEANFTSSKVLEIKLTEGGSQQIQAENIFIDCGSSPMIPAIEGLSDVTYLTSTSIIELEDLPEHLLIMGGGYIGLEFGQMFKRFGSQVSILEHGSQLLSREDPDIAGELAAILQQEEIHLFFNTEVTKVARSSSGGIELTLMEDGKTRTVQGSHLLVAVGTRPNTKALNLDAAGVKINDKGYIVVNEQLETNQAGIYALGDIKGGPEFTHISYDDYRIVEKNLLEKENATTKDRMIPYTVFTDPQLGRIGLSEKEARKQGFTIKTAVFPMKYVARAIETGHMQGMMKAVIDAETSQILGAAILGIEGGEVMSMIQIAMMGKLPYPKLRDAVLAHPTLAESLNSLFSKVE